MRRSFRRALVFGLAWAFSGTLGHTEPPEGSSPTLEVPAARAGGGNAERAVVSKGVRIEFSVEPVAGRRAGPAPPMEGEFAEVRFRVTDAETGAPVSPLQPAAWVSRTSPSEDIACKDRIGRYLQGLLSFQADVDLNKYFILILNNDQTISVVDPLLGVSGITQLYAMIMLKDSGEDWTRSADGKRLFVTMPKADQLAVVDLESFKVITNVATGDNPMRVALQPDGRYLWVGSDATSAAESGVTVIDARSHAVAAFVPTGAGHHEIAFSDDSLLAFVLNEGSGTLSIVDTQRLTKVRDIAIGESPRTVEFSSLSREVYVADASGEILVLEGETGRLRRRLATTPGLVSFRLDPSGRWGFAASAAANRVDIVDVSRTAVTRHLEVPAQPHQFAFTDTYAYVRHLGTSEVTLIPLAQLGGRAAPGIQKIPMGDKPPGEYDRHATADAISPTGEWTSVVAVNPADRMVYYYMEGMIAPMGSYSAYGRVPRAVGVVDRSLRETSRGVYSARFRVPRSGEYNVALLIDSPVVGHCFAFTAEANPAAAADRQKELVQIQFLNTRREAPVGEEFPLVFSLTTGPAAAPAPRGDVRVLVTRPPGVWQERLRAQPLGDGRYQTSIVPSEPGVYYVSVALPSLGVGFTELPYFTFRATLRSARAQKGR